DAVLPDVLAANNLYLQGWNDGGRSWMAAMTGRPDAARDAAESGQRAARKVGETATDGFTTMTLAGALADTGRTNDRFAELRHAEKTLTRRPGMFTAEFLAVGRVRALLAAADAARARDIAMEVVESLAANGVNLIRGTALGLLARASRMC